MVLQGQLTLQKFWFYVQPTLHTMEIMAAIATSINRVSRTLSLALIFVTLDVDMKLCVESLKMLVTHGTLSLSALGPVAPSKFKLEIT